MVRSSRTFLPVAGHPAALLHAFEGDPARWLPSARRDGPDTYIILVRAGTLTRTVTATIGSPWRAGSARWRSLSWDPSGEDASPAPVERLLPSFDGEIGVHVASPERVTLVLDGRYLPPGGAVGTAADVVALGRIARQTVHRLAADVAARLTAEAMLIGDEPSSGKEHIHG